MILAFNFGNRLKHYLTPNNSSSCNKSRRILYRLIITLLNRLVFGPWAICDVVKVHPSFPRYPGELTTKLTWGWARGSRSFAESTRYVAYDLDNRTYNLSKLSLSVRKLHTHLFWTILGNTESIL